MTRPAGTESFALNQTMLRIRDPKPSLAFYQDVLGMTLLQKLDFEEMRFSLYFLAYLAEGESIPDEACARFESLGVSFKKRPQDGKMKDIAFITDPDGYWIEILSAAGMKDSLPPR